MQLQNISTKIYEIRGVRVMLDYDLAKLYETETKRIKEAVRRNEDRFPDDFMFVLTRSEYDSLRTQIASLKTGRGKHSKFLPFAFTEQGVAMLSSVLNSQKAIQINIQIIRTFVLIRQFALSHKELSDKLRQLEERFDRKFSDKEPYLCQKFCMLLINTIRERKEEVIRRLAVKNFDATELVDKALEIDIVRRATQAELDHILASQNSLAKEVGDLYKAGKKAEADDLKNKSIALKEEASTLSQRLDTSEKELYEILVRLPNLPSEQVPEGRSPENNEVVYTHAGAFPEVTVPHWELAAKYNLIDFELGVKLTGAGFPVYKGKGARLQRALINFFLDRATAAGYLEIQPPILVNEDSGFGTGQLPDKEGQMYHVGIDNLYLIPTAEVPVTNILRDVILKAEDMPVMMTAYTPCFRREAGSYGKDVRGLNRLHQFDKVEIVQIANPDKSYEILEEMREYVAGLIRDLELPYRILKLCGGDMSFASALTYDLEVYSAAQKKWLEVSSVSNFETFQSNRLKLRFRQGQNKPQPAHTLNGSALALPRIVAALLENNQSDRGIKIPAALVPYTGFEWID